MVRKSQIEKLVYRVKDLFDDGVVKKSDFVNWLKNHGVDVSRRTSWDEIVNRIYQARIDIKVLEEFIRKYEEVEEEVERVTIEKVKRRKKTETVASRREKSVSARVSSKSSARIIAKIIDLAYNIYKDPSLVRESIIDILDSIGARYTKSEDINDIVASLSKSAAERLLSELNKRKEWRKFQDEVLSWIIKKIPLANEIKTLDSGELGVEKYLHGASGVQYRFDIAGFGEKSSFLSTKRYLLLAECKSYSTPVDVYDIMVFREKVMDVVEDFEPDNSKCSFMFFSASGYTERAKLFAKNKPVIVNNYEVPIELYEKKGSSFVKVV